MYYQAFHQITLVPLSSQGIVGLHYLALVVGLPLLLLMVVSTGLWYDLCGTVYILGLICMSLLITTWKIEQLLNYNYLLL